MLVVAAVVLICLGGLIGATWTTQVMGTVSRRHATERKNLNDGWRALQDAKQSDGDPVHCARCHQTLAMSGRPLVSATAYIDEDDDEA